MGQRSRKRGRRAQATPGTTRTASPSPAPAPAPARDAAKPARVRGEARNAQVRASLVPLAPGERPRAVTVAAIVALVLAVANVALYAAGLKLQSKGAGSTGLGVFIFAGIMLAAAAGMWRAKYWAVLGFQALLALTVLIAALSLVRASNLAAVALCVAILGFGGWLFWKLVRALARIQMPERRPRG